MTEEDNEDFEKSTKCLICDNYYVDGDAKARDHCHITGKDRGSAHRHCIINVKLNHKIPDQFLSFSLESLVKNLVKDDFKYLSQEFENNALDLVKQKGFYPYEYMNDFEKFKRSIS